MSSPIRNCVIVGIDETIRIKTRAALDAAVPTSTLFMDKGVRSGFSICHAKIPEVLVVEWDVFPAEEITMLLQKFRKLTGCMNNHVILISAKAGPELTAVAIEYGVYQILLQDQLAKKIKNTIREIVTELSQPTALRTRLMALEQASAKGDQILFNYTVEQLYQQFPESPRAKIEFANLCLAQGRFQEAENIARRALVFEPGNLRVQNIFARSCLHQKKTSEALKLLEQSEHLSPGNLDRLLMLGDTYLNMNRVADARKKFENALKVDEENEEALAGIVGAELKDANLNEALCLLRESCTEVERAALFNNAGILAARSGRVVQACALYETAIRSLSTNRLKARVHFNIGLAHERALQFEEAIRQFARSTELDSLFVKSKRHSEGLRKMLSSGGDLLRSPGDLVEQFSSTTELDEFDDLVAELQDEKLDRALNGPHRTSQRASPVSPKKEMPFDPANPSIIEMATKERILKGFPVDVVPEGKKR